MNAVVSFTHRRARGYILQALNYYPNDTMNADVIGDFVRNCGVAVCDGEVKTHLTYLQSKGYVEANEVGDARLGSIKVTVAKITPKGVDLLEANIPEDPGVILPNSR